MWKNTWGVKEGIMTCGGLIAIGLILHLFTGAVDWSSFAWPLNICILTVYVVVLIMLYILRKSYILFVGQCRIMQLYHH